MTDAVATDGPPPPGLEGARLSDRFQRSRVPMLPTVLFADASEDYRSMARDALLEGRTATDLLILLPLVAPEVVLGSSLLTLFVGLRIPLGFATILIAHVLFCLSFVVVTVRARLAGLDPALEDAARDLYATGSQAFLRVTLGLRSTRAEVSRITFDAMLGPTTARTQSGSIR